MMYIDEEQGEEQEQGRQYMRARAQYEPPERLHPTTPVISNSKLHLARIASGGKRSSKALAISTEAPLLSVASSVMLHTRCTIARAQGLQLNSARLDRNNDPRQRRPSQTW
jgi:hypothetical protein